MTKIIEYRRDKNTKPNVKFGSGFTLLELVVDIGILMVLLFMAVALLDPGEQLRKVGNTNRIKDIDEVSKAANIYYHDQGCFPETVPFGEEWLMGQVVVMSETPQDPTCDDSVGYCYHYVADNSSCAQWNVVFSRLAPPINPHDECPIDPTCLPSNYQLSGYNHCRISGIVDCEQLSNSVLPLPGSGGGFITPTNTPAPTSMPTSTPTPTPTIVIPTATPTPISCTSNNWSCTGTPQRCNVVPDGTGTYCTSNCDGVC